MNTASFVAFSGGVGGAKLALGLSRVLPADALLIVGNTGDDFDHLGLRICPDLDTLVYTLGGVANPVQGWGVADESWRCMEALGRLGGPDWFRLGDTDLATHLYRSQRLRDGASLSVVTAELAAAFGITHRIVPMSDAPVATVVHTAGGPLAFQQYFVREQCQPAVTGFEFAGAAEASVQSQLAATLAAGPQAIVLCPSNPFVSIDPILALPGLRQQLAQSAAPVVAVSPLVGGQAIKGPTAKMMHELGLALDVASIAKHYQGLLDGLVIDEQDRAQAAAVEALGLRVRVAPTIMQTEADKTALAQVVLDFVADLK